MNKQKWMLSLSIIAGAMGCISQSDSQVDQTQEITGILITGADQMNTGACVVYKIRPLNAQNQPVSVAQQVQFRLSSTGNGQTYLDAACENPGANVTIAQGDSSAEFYIQNNTLESFEIRYQGQAIKTIEVTTFSQVGSQQLDGPVQDLLPLREGSGSVYVGGDFDQAGGVPSGSLARLTVNGHVDSNFIVEGGFSLGAGNAMVNALMYANDFSNDLFVGGLFSAYKDSNIPRVAKIFSNGQLDNLGIINHVSGRVKALLRIEQNDMVMGGQFSQIYPCNGGVTSYTSRHVGKINDSLVFDPVFLNVSTLSTICDDPSSVLEEDEPREFFDSSDDVDVLHEATANLFYIGGRLSHFNAEEVSSIIRINATSGARDTSFNAPYTNNKILAIQKDSQDRIYIGGTFINLDSDRLIRLSPSGMQDNSFNTGTGFEGLSGTSVNALYLTSNDQLYVGGNFTQYNGQPVGHHLIRLNDDGSVDETFDVGTGFNGTVSVIRSAGDQSGDIFVGGAFTQFDGQSANYVVRLSATGAID